MKILSKYLFVYGSLRSGFKLDAYNYISSYFNLVDSAKAKGILYDMGNYPVAVLDANENFIVGELYEIKNASSLNFALAQLDDYEGVDSNSNNKKSNFTRELVDVFYKSCTVKANSYWFTGNVTNKPIISSGDVMQYYLQKTKSL
jgi:gamma-glutamylcyclotransferase (GGCT)/AIG2-like uncharacterized protein YtfP